MPIKLEKGEKVFLEEHSHLQRLKVGLGWDANKRRSGFIEALFGTQSGFDCDASVIMLENGRFLHKKDLIYFGNRLSPCGSVLHSGDNVSGEGDGDDEIIYIQLNRIPNRIDRLLFIVNIYECESRKQDFGMMQNAYIRIEDEETKIEIARFQLTEDYSGMTTLLVAELSRHEGGWMFTAIGAGTNDKSLGEIALRYQ